MNVFAMALEECSWFDHQLRSGFWATKRDGAMWQPACSESSLPQPAALNHICYARPALSLKRRSLKKYESEHKSWMHCNCGASFDGCISGLFKKPLYRTHKNLADDHVQSSKVTLWQYIQTLGCQDYPALVYLLSESKGFTVRTCWA